MAKKIYILDTSACLTDANCIRSYGNNDIVLPLKVLEEIDNNKKDKMVQVRMLELSFVTLMLYEKKVVYLKV